MRSIQQSLAIQNDLEGILEYLESHRGSYADKFAVKFDKALRLLATQPRQRGYRGARDDLTPGLRYRTIGNFTLYYRFDSTTVTLVRILYGRRDIDRFMRDDNEA